MLQVFIGRNRGKQSTHMPEEAETTKKQHNPRQAGRKKVRKDSKGKSTPTKNDRSSNPKAFAFKSGSKASMLAQRSSDIIEKKMHVPLVDRSGLEPAPVIVAVVGPPGVRRAFFSFYFILFYFMFIRLEKQR